MTADTAHPLRGVALLLCALLLFAVLDATAKHLAATLPVPMLAWGRYTVHLLLMLIVLGPSQRGALIATRRPAAQAVRGLMLAGTTVFGIAAFRTMPLAETTALIFVSPLLVALLAGRWLGERVGRLRWIAVATGFAGVLLIARPGGALSGSGIAYALGAATCYSIYQLQTRQLGRTESTLTMLFYTALVGTAVLSLTLPLFWDQARPSGLQVLMICSLGLYGGGGHFLLIRAFRHAPASLLSPFLYVQLVWATLLGWLVFDHLPDRWAIVGGVVIAASGLALAFGERRAVGAREGQRKL